MPFYFHFLLIQESWGKKTVFKIDNNNNKCFLRRKSAY